MGTRKSKKSNKRFRKTRSKRQRGGNNEAANKELFAAAAMGPLQSVITALENGADINARSLIDRVWKTPFMIALEENEHEIVEYLIMNNLVNLDEKLIRYIQNEKIDNVEKLLMLGADPNAEVDTSSAEPGQHTGVCALWWACWVKNTELVKMLLHWGADVNARCGKSYTSSTPLGVACTITRGDPKIEIVKLLLKHRGIDVTGERYIPPVGGNPVLVQGVNKDIIEDLIRKHIAIQPIKQKLEREFVPKHLTKQRRLEVGLPLAEKGIPVGPRNKILDFLPEKKNWGGKRKTRKTSRK